MLQKREKSVFQYLVLLVRLLRDLMMESKNVQVLLHEPMGPERTKVLAVTDLTLGLVYFISAVTAIRSTGCTDPGLASPGLLPV